MTARRPCPSAPGPLEGYAAAFDDLFGTVAQRRGFRAYLQGLLLPHDRLETLTGLAGAEPTGQAQAAEVQRPQFFLSESTWDADAVNARRVELLMQEPELQAHEGGVLVLDDTGDRKKGTHTTHVGRQYLGSAGKIDNGIVAVTSLWAAEHVSYPLHVRPFTPKGWFAKGQSDPAYRSKPPLAVEVVDAALAAGGGFRAVVADCSYGESVAMAEALIAAEIPFVLALRPSKPLYGPCDAAHSPGEAARRLAGTSAAEPGDWAPVERTFRAGHTETWWAAELEVAGFGPQRTPRLVVATTDPGAWPGLSPWYLLTNLPPPTAATEAAAGVASADLAEVVRLYGLRNWIEHGYKQVKDELGWADFRVRSDQAIRRHWALVCCAFSSCWRTRLQAPPPRRPPATPATHAAPAVGRGENPPRGRAATVLAGGAAGRARLVGAVDVRPPLLAGRGRERAATT